MKNTKLSISNWNSKGNVFPAVAKELIPAKIKSLINKKPVRFMQNKIKKVQYQIILCSFR
jgi:hypothetical protein